MRILLGLGPKDWFSAQVEGQPQMATAACSAEYAIGELILLAQDPTIAVVTAPEAARKIAEQEAVGGWLRRLYEQEVRRRIREPPRRHRRAARPDNLRFPRGGG